LMGCGQVCAALLSTMEWAEAHPSEAQAISRSGQALARDEMRMEQIYHYMAHVLRAASRLLNYSAASAASAHNATRVPTDRASFRRWLRPDSFSQIGTVDGISASPRYDGTLSGFHAIPKRHVSSPSMAIRVAPGYLLP